MAVTDEPQGRDATDSDDRRSFGRHLEWEKAMEEFQIEGEKRHREMREDLEAMERHIEASGRILDELKRSL